LLEAGADVNLADSETGTSPLHAAAARRHLAAARLLISNDANVRGVGTDGMTPLHLAAAYGHLEMAAALLASGADVNAHKHSGWTPLHDAANENRDLVIELLLARGADVEARETKGGTSLHLAAQNGHLESVRTLVEVGGRARRAVRPVGSRARPETRQARCARA